MSKSNGKIIRKGTLVRIKPFAGVGRDMCCIRWGNDPMVFRVTSTSKSRKYPRRFRLSAPGYGEEGSYGSGHIYASRDALEVAGVDAEDED